MITNLNTVEVTQVSGGLEIPLAGVFNAVNANALNTLAGTVTSLITTTVTAAVGAVNGLVTAVRGLFPVSITA